MIVYIVKDTERNSIIGVCSTITKAVVCVKHYLEEVLKCEELIKDEETYKDFINELYDFNMTSDYIENFEFEAHSVDNY